MDNYMEINGYMFSIKGIKAVTYVNKHAYIDYGVSLAYPSNGVWIPVKNFEEYEEISDKIFERINEVYG